VAQYVALKRATLRHSAGCGQRVVLPAARQPVHLNSTREAH